MIVCNTRNLYSSLTGVQRYTSEILRRFSNSIDVIKPSRPLQGLEGHLWEQVVLPFRLKGRLLWSPSNTGPLGVEKQVVSIMDVSPLDYPEWTNQKFSKWYKFLIPRLASRARAILTISEFSKQRILAHCPQAKDKIYVTMLATDSRFRPADALTVAHVISQLQLPTSNYIIALGSLEPRKNLKTLLMAWESVRASIKEDVWLVIAGAKGKTLVFGEHSFTHLPSRVYLTGHVPDDALPALYSGAMASVYLSYYEGFGLPPLESMACGTPVLTSNASSLPEVTGNAAMTVNPYDVDAVGDCLIKIVADADFRNDLKCRGLERAKLFSWEKTAQQTLRLLEEVDNSK